MSLSARRVWIEINPLYLNAPTITSLSARRVWIEILYQQLDTKVY